MNKQKGFIGSIVGKYFVQNKECFEDEEYEDDVVDHDLYQSGTVHEIVVESQEQLDELLGRSTLKLTLKSYLGRVVSVSKFTKMLYTSTNANTNLENKHLVNSDGHLVAPISFWREIESVVDHQLEMEKKESSRGLGFRSSNY